MYQFGRIDRVMPSINDALTKSSYMAVANFTNSVSDMIMAHREEAIQHVLTNIGIVTEDLSKYLMSIENRADRIDAMGNYLLSKGYHMTIEVERRPVEPFSSSNEKIRVWRLSTTADLDIKVMVTNNPEIQSSVATIQSTMQVNKHE